MSDFSGVEERDYVPLEDLKVEFRRDGDAEEADGCFALSFWIYIDNCASFPSSILVQVFLLTRPSFVCLCEKWTLMCLLFFFLAAFYFLMISRMK